MLNTHEVCRYAIDALPPDTLPIVVSKSGYSSEVIELLPKLEERAPVIAVVNTADSPLAAKSQLKLWMRAGPETQTASKSYVCTLAVLNVLAADLAGDSVDAVLDDVARLADWMCEFLDRADDNTAPLVEWAGDGTHVDVLGSGPSMSSAYQAGLILREGVGITTAAINCADYAHGWYKAVQPGTLGIVFAPDYDSGSVEGRVARSIADRGGKVMVVTAHETAKAGTALMVRHPVVPEQLAPLAQIVPCSTLMGWLMG